MTAPRIAIVGAGVAGLACARVLSGGGLSPVIFDKSRGVGGRLATRRAEGGLQFDHGAPAIAAHEPMFAAEVQAATRAGALTAWPDAGPTSYVGQPGMSGFARHLALGLDLRHAETATQVSVETGQVALHFADEVLRFDQVILALPAPQILRLIGADHGLSSALSRAQMSPCLTLMAALLPGLVADLPARVQNADEDGLQTILCDSAKPGRSSQAGQAWVAHAGQTLTRQHLEAPAEEIAAQMLPHLTKALGCDRAQIHYAVAHRWRYARVAHALGQAYVSDASGRLHCAGDWCLGPDAQDAWTSGAALGRAVLAGA